MLEEMDYKMETDSLRNCRIVSCLLWISFFPLDSEIIYSLKLPFLNRFTYVNIGSPTYLENNSTNENFIK